MKKSFSALMIFLFIQAVFSKEVKICSEPVEFLETFIPGSGISIRLGANYNSFYDDFAQWHGEGIGIFPDFWSTSEDLNETIFLATKDEAMKEKLSKIGERLL